MPTRKSTPSKFSQLAKKVTPRPAPVKKVPVQTVTHSKTMANGQPRPKRRG